MKKLNLYDRDEYRKWFEKQEIQESKGDFIRTHFEKVARADTILVVNAKKGDVEGYIGGNTFMEMAVAYYLKIPIVVWRPLPPDSPYLEELKGMEPQIANENYKIVTDVLKASRNVVHR